MMDYVSLGSAPAEEDCAQVGSPDYKERMLRESKAYIGQLGRMFGDPPVGARLTIRGFNHDFGTYHEVCVVYNDIYRVALEWAFKLENEAPGRWDDIARKELGLV